MERDRPLIKVHFYFGYHGSEDVVHIPEIKREAEEFFCEDPQVSNIFFQEAAEFGEHEVKGIRTLISRGYSHVDALLQTRYPYSTIGRPLYPSELRKLRTQMNNPDSEYYYWMMELSMLDDLAQVRKFEYDAESYPKNLLASQERQHQAYIDAYKAAFQAARTGDLRGIIHHGRSAVAGDANYLRGRNMSVAKQLEERVLKEHKKRRETRMFISFGEVHDLLPEVLRQRLSRHRYLAMPEIIGSYDLGQQLKRPNDLLVQRKELDPNYTPNDEDVMRGILGGIVDGELDTKGISTATSIPRLNRIIGNITLDEIEKFITSLPSKEVKDAVNELVLASL